jgi:sec-independent protein translocase protein TatB
MFDVAPSELLIIVVVAVIVIGPKELPTALRTAGRWIAKMRKVSGHFRSGLDAMIREAELEELEKKWAEQNAKIMREHPMGVEEAERTGAYPTPVMEPLPAPAPQPPATPAADPNPDQ